jgi:hypothetical protein
VAKAPSFQTRYLRSAVHEARSRPRKPMDNEKTSEDGGDSDAATVGRRDLVQPRRERRNPTRGLL